MKTENPIEETMAFKVLSSLSLDDGREPVFDVDGNQSLFYTMNSGGYGTQCKTTNADRVRVDCTLDWHQVDFALARAIDGAPRVQGLHTVIDAHTWFSAQRDLMMRIADKNLIPSRIMIPTKPLYDLSKGCAVDDQPGLLTLFERVCVCAVLPQPEMLGVLVHRRVGGLDKYGLLIRQSLIAAIDIDHEAMEGDVQNGSWTKVENRVIRALDMWEKNFHESLSHLHDNPLYFTESPVGSDVPGDRYLGLRVDRKSLGLKVRSRLIALRQDVFRRVHSLHAIVNAEIASVCGRKPTWVGVEPDDIRSGTKIEIDILKPGEQAIYDVDEVKYPGWKAPIWAVNGDGQFEAVEVRVGRARIPLWPMITPGSRPILSSGISQFSRVVIVIAPEVQATGVGTTSFRPGSPLSVGVMAYSR